MEKVQVLMSTYNGVSYLKTQLDSIIKQKDVDIDLLIRDDGSTDGTQEILKEYTQIYSWIHWFQGENIGVQRSFFELILKADISIKYFAFADQDDKWLPDKLNHAVIKIQEIEQSEQLKQDKKNNNQQILKIELEEREPVLYCGDKYIVDEQLCPISVTISRIVRKVSFGNALVQNICTGCTAMLNRELLLLIQKHIPKHLEYVIMHDWWFYLVASCFGKVFYDEQPYILYRQHGKNTSGAMLNRRKLIVYRLKQFLSPRGQIYQQVEEFCEAFRFIGTNKNYAEKVLNSRKSLKGKICLIKEREIFRQKRSDDLVFRLVLLLGKL